MSDMNISEKIMDMESDEDTFTLQVTDDSGLEDNLKLENSEIQDIECSNEHIDVDPKDNEDIDFTDKQWEYLPSALDGVEFEVGKNGANLEKQQAREDIQLLVNQKNSTQVENLNGEFEVGRIDASLEEQQALKDFELILNEEKDKNCTQDENVSREFEVRSDVSFEKQKALEDLELIMNQEKKQNFTQVGNFDREPVEINFNLKDQQAVENKEFLVNQKTTQDCKKIENTNRELEEGEIEDNEIEMDHDSAREQREKSAELIVVPDEVNDRLFDNVSDFSDVSTVDNSYYDDFEYTTSDRNPSPPDDGEFSTYEDDDPWDYVEASLSDDCVIVDEIECLSKAVQSHTVPEENSSKYSRRDQSDEEVTERYNNNSNNEKSKSRKRKSSTSSNHDSVEEVNVGNKNVDPDYDDFTGICSKEEVSELPDDDKSISKKRKSHHGRDEDHPLFRDVDAEFCEKLMRVKKQGEIIVRPSSKGSDYLKITWKVTDGICQHIKVKKKLKSRSSNRYRYWINNKEFRSLDDIINSFVTPMAENALKLLEYKHFKQGINGVKATAEELLKAEKNKNPNCIPYIISAVKKSPGKFLISYLPRVTCYHEYIKIVAEGFRFRDQPFDNLIDLLIYFKANSKEVKPVALKDEIVTSTTTSRPGTPRPPTPKIHDLTPSILEVIQDLPDEKLESMRQILDSLAQSASNPPAFNQNRTPPFMFNGYHHQPFAPVPFPFPSYQQTFRPVGLGLPPGNNVPLPVPYPKNLDLPVPNYNLPSTSRVTNLPLPPGT
ncbi:Similar to SUPT6H: Transcription elongation factor SPT6 (Homo sapiens) [Cotesia congregata]|uniref:Similar to SUPT6H: Transcription elongation factor SPT6 (Homo sapiens) n=1 Tax=Cotesia congregata TaxID=51543 RepID=A0A8J2HTS2_COTCN|nr:Similar to SUPT6H: Transcription elongation factor SPT6 (Homo sapiens) [Cotesia congregata]